MSTTVLEQTRAAHEMLEVQERLIVRDFKRELKGHKERLHQNHRVRQRLDAMQEQAQRLVEIYQDEDDSRKEDIAALQVTDPSYAKFYERVKELRDYHRKHSAYDVTEAPNDEALLRVEPRVEFSGEEAYGRYLDLHEHYQRFVNSKFGRQLEYAEYVRTLMAWSEISRRFRLTKPYREYLQLLLRYLEGFHDRINPLNNRQAIYARLQEEFEQAWEGGQLAGWEDRGTGQAPGQQAQPVVDLQAFDTVEELQTLSADTIKKALAALNLKCGGTPKERAERLLLTKATPLDKLDKKLFVRGAAPLAARTREEVARQAAAARDAALLELRVSTLCGDRDLLGRVLEDTAGNIEKKQARTYEEMQAEQEEAELEAAPSDSDEEDDFIYNPLKLPLGWDGKPIPYWLYKLHGLNQEFKCEICGGYSYWGRRAFERHFREARHQQNMRLLGIPNTKNFYEVTQIEDAQRLWQNIQEREKPGHKIEVDEEFEDAAGNVYNKKTFEDLRRQGLLQ